MNDILVHYGVSVKNGAPGRGSGRYPLGSGKDPKKKLEGRLTKKFEKADTKTQTLQDRANKAFDKAYKQENSIFKFRQKRAEDSYNTGYDYESIKRSVEYRMLKTYKRYEKKFSKYDIKMDPKLRKKGREYYEKVRKNSNAQFNAALAAYEANKRSR